MKRCPAFVVLAACAALLSAVAAAERTVVLVTGASCPITDIDNLGIRKAYLGVAVIINGRQVRPLRLSGDDQLSRVFYQSIVAMSRKSYERRAVSLALKFGTPRPAEYDDLDAALDVIRRIECSVVYAWAHDIDNQPGIKILRLLWHGE